MMIDVLVSGRLAGQPAQRVSKSTGKPFVAGKVRVQQRDGNGVYVNLLCFDDSTGRKLLALGDGDTVSLSGSMTLQVWTDGQGQAHPAADLVVQGVLSAYSVRKKREAMQQAPAPARPVPAPAAGWERMYQRNGNTGGGLEDDPL